MFGVTFFNEPPLYYVHLERISRIIDWFNQKDNNLCNYMDTYLHSLAVFPTVVTNKNEVRGRPDLDHVLISLDTVIGENTYLHVECVDDFSKLSWSRKDMSNPQAFITMYFTVNEVNITVGVKGATDTTVITVKRSHIEELTYEDSLIEEFNLEDEVRKSNPSIKCIKYELLGYIERSGVNTHTGMNNDSDEDPNPEAIVSMRVLKNCIASENNKTRNAIILSHKKNPMTKFGVEKMISEYRNDAKKKVSDPLKYRINKAARQRSINKK